MAGILKYFKYKRDVLASPSESLPEPSSSLKKRVPSKAAEVTKLTENSGARGLTEEL